MMQRLVRYEGGHIGISGDMVGAIDWYCKHLGVTLAWHSPAERMCVMHMPGKIHAIALIGVDKAGNRAPNVRLTFQTPDLLRTHAILTAEGVRTTPVVPGPGGIECFDFYDLEGNRLTAVANPALEAEHSGARFVLYGAPRIGVSNLAAAQAWYEVHLGFKLRHEHTPTESALFDLGNDVPIWLERLPTDAFTGQQESSVRPFFGSWEIIEAHQYFEAQGLTPSAIAGTPNSLQLFHFYDPDGNRVNVWTYSGAKALYEEHQANRTARYL